MKSAKDLLIKNKLLQNNYKRPAYYSTRKKLSECDVEEIKIPVPYGHIAGKWWGNKNEIPILALHGWQDNANSFDRLIPLLNVSSFLAIDLPGHGYSSHLPPGKIYSVSEFVFTLRRVIKYFNWSKSSLLGHSFGSLMAHAYASIYRDEVDCLISLECTRSLQMMYAGHYKFVADGIDKMLKIEKQMAESPPPAYRLTELVRKCIEGSLGSITPESALILLKRGAAEAKNMEVIHKKPSDKQQTDLSDYLEYEKSKMHKSEGGANEIHRVNENVAKNINKMQDLELPVAKDKFYILLRDPRLKVNAFGTLNEEQLNYCAKSIKCPVLVIRAEDGFLYAFGRDVYESTREIMRKNCRYFEDHEVKGLHHTHLNTPENVASIVNGFLEKVKNVKN